MTEAERAVIDAAVEYQECGFSGVEALIDAVLRYKTQPQSPIELPPDAQALIATVKRWATDMQATDAELVEAYNQYERSVQS